MKKSLFLSLFVCCFGFSSQGQGIFQPKQFNSPQSKGIVYNKEFTIDVRLHTNGFAFAANFGKIKTYYKTRYYHLEIGEIRHAKQERQNRDWAGWSNSKSSKSFFLGKRNSLYVVRAGIGEKRYFSEKAREKGLAIGMSYEAGPSIGLLKPYYLEIIRPTDDPSEFAVTSEKYSSENASEFLDFYSIYGSSGFTKGIGEVRPLLGLHGKLGVHFDWGAFDEYVKAMDVGIMMDLYFKKVPIMVENDAITNSENHPFFINLYLTLQLGKRS